MALSSAMSDVTRMLNALEQGEAEPGDQLLTAIYDQLRNLAVARLAQERPGQTLQATALVHEAWLRLTNAHPGQWAGRKHFFAAAAQAMRRILIENARRKKRRRHGGHLQRVDIAGLDLPSPLPDDELLALDEALKTLAQTHPDAAELVELCFFTGLTQAEAGAHLGVSVATAERTWAFARAWLYREIRKEL